MSDVINKVDSPRMPTTVSAFADPKALEQVIQQLIDTAQQMGATQVEAALDVGVAQEVSVRQNDLESIQYHRDKSLGLTVYVGQKKGSASTGDFSAAAIKHALEAAINLAQYTESDDCAGLADAAEMQDNIRDLSLYHPWHINTDEAVQLALEAESAAFATDKRIVNADGTSVHTHQSYHLYGNSHGFLSGYPTARHSLSCVMVGQDGGHMERDYDYTIARRPQDLWAAQKVGERAANHTIKRLNSRTVPTQTVPVAFDAHVSAALIAQFVAAVSGGRLFRHSSFLCDSLEQPVFPKGFQLIENPYIPVGLGSTPFDNDGVGTIARDIVSDGYVKSYVLSAYSARKLGMKNTGNAGGVSNLIVQYPTNTVPDIIKNMNTGFWVTEVMGQGINLVNGDYSRGAAGFWVENGEVAYPVSGVTIAGNLRDMFQGIAMIGNDVDPRHSIQVGSILIDKMTVAGH